MENVLNFEWRIGASAHISSSQNGCGCTPTGQACLWHNSFCDDEGENCQRSCMGLDIGATSGDPTYISGVNPSLSSVSLWAMRLNDCAAVAMASPTQPTIALPISASDPVVRYAHMDFDSSNPRNLRTGVWPRVGSVAPLSATTISLSQVSPQQPNNRDLCSWRYFGEHLHMDAPGWATKNCDLYHNQQVDTGDLAFTFGPEPSAADLVWVQYRGTERISVQLDHHGRFDFEPEHQAVQVRWADAKRLVDLPNFILVVEPESDRYSDLDGPTPCGHC